MDIIVHQNGADLSRQPVRDDLDDLAAAFSAASKSPATRRAYRSDWSDFTAWCSADNVAPAPADSRTLGRYFSHLASIGRSTATIDRRSAAIACAHRALGFDSPLGREDVRAVLSGIRNQLGRRPEKKQALTADLVLKVVRKIKDDSLIGSRDRALILLCFGAALRRSELVALRVSDLEFDRKGLLVKLGRTKTDQTGKGRNVAVPDGKLKIPGAVKDWLIAAKLTDGPVFRAFDGGSKVKPEGMTGGQFARILKARCEDAGLDPNAVSGHSPRRGFATSAGDAGADLRMTANHMRHAKLETTMGYIEDAEMFRKHAGKGFL